MIIFEKVLFIRKIDPPVELAWTRWIIEAEQDYNDMFAIEAINEKIPTFQRGVFGCQKWNEMVTAN